eukprot:SAG31_NODE_19650_length_595_cov_1.205645_1_plen_138_part_10
MKSNRPNAPTLMRWWTYICQPHVFVLLCLVRRFTSVRKVVVGTAFIVLLWLEIIASLVSVLALWGLLAPPSPAGLAHGAGGLMLAYSLTCVAVAGTATRHAVAAFKLASSKQSIGCTIGCIVGGCFACVLAALCVYLV